MFESGDLDQARERPGTVIVTCALDSRAHAVRDTELTTSQALNTGRLNALCGHVITAAPLCEPDGAPCPACAQLRQPPARPRRAGGLRRLRGDR